MTPKHGYILLFLIFTGLTLNACGSGGGGEVSPSPTPSPQTDPTPLFSSAKPISGPSGDSEGLLLGFDASGNVSVAWMEPVDGHREGYLAKISPQGEIRQPPKSLWEGHGFSDLRMASGKAKTYFAWIGSLSASSGCESSPREAFLLEPFAGPSPNLLSSIECNPPPYPVSDLDLASSNGSSEQFFAAWSEGAAGGKKIYLRGYSSTSGTFKPTALKVSESANDSSLPRLATEGGEIANLVWLEQTLSGKRVGVARTEDGGSSLTGKSYLPSPGLDTGCPPETGSGGGRVHIAWIAADGTGERSIHLMTSQDHLNFSESLVLPVDPAATACPHLSVRNRGEAFLAWESEGEIYFLRFQTGKDGLTGPVNISRSPGPDRFSSNPRIALDGPAINLVWEEKINGIGQIYFSGSKDGGATFSDPVNLSLSAEDAVSPAIKADRAGNVAVAWTQGAPGGRHIYLMIGPGAKDLPVPFVSYSGITNNDVNRDGIDDIIVGALSDGSGTHGKAYLFLGGAPPDQTPDATLHGFDGPPGSFPEDLFGAATALGDINGDGASDVLIGAPSYENEKGVVYLFFGPAVDPDRPDVVIEGIEDNGRMGASLVSVGDINKDGAEDILIGAPYVTGTTSYSGGAFLFLGGRSLAAKTSFPLLKSSDADRVYSGAESWSQFGMAVAGVGDVNGDGYHDFAIGAPSEDSNRGSIYLFYGGAAPPLDPGKTLRGLNNGDQLGVSITAADELNGDGYSDFVAGSMIGTATLFFGNENPSGPLPALTFSNPDTPGNGFGETVGGTGDVNGDGFDDLLIAAPYANDGDRMAVGKVYLYLGGTEIAGKPDRVFVGEQSLSYFGSGALRIAGDINGDGLSDILIGASHWNGSGQSGTAYLFWGNPDWKITETIPAESALSADARLLSLSPDEHFGNAVWRKQIP